MQRTGPRDVLQYLNRLSDVRERGAALVKRK